MRASIIVTVFVAGFAGGLFAASQTPASQALPAERVTGIGGVFFKAQDPKALGAWYREKLGVSMMDGGQFALFRWRDGEDPSRKARRCGRCSERRATTSHRARPPSW